MEFKDLLLAGLWSLFAEKVFKSSSVFLVFNNISFFFLSAPLIVPAPTAAAIVSGEEGKQGLAVGDTSKLNASGESNG